MKLKDHIGKQYTRLKVIDVIVPGKLKCICNCGNLTIVQTHHINTNKGAKSCGCLQKEQAAIVCIERNKPIHGKSGTSIYNTWAQMLARCNNKSNENYFRYGGRGIKVIKRWRKFEEFYTDMGDPPIGLTLDRRNNDKGYSKRNCRWATRNQQAKNRRERIRNKVGQYI